MTTVLLISDNPVFIRSACKCLEPLHQIRLCVSLRVSVIFEEYLQYSPAVIILDHTFLFPIPSILKHFSDYRWTCAFIFVGASSAELNAFPNVTCVSETGQLPLMLERLCLGLDDAAPDTMAEIKEAILPTSKENRSPVPDVYYLMLSISTAAQNEPLDPLTLKRLQAQITTVGELDGYTALPQGLLIRMKKSTLHMQGAFRQIHSIVCKTLGAQYASICCEEIPQIALEDTLKKMMDCAPLHIFFSSHCLDLSQVQTAVQQCPPVNVLPIFVRLIKSLLNKRPDVLQDILREWYLTTLKTQLDLKSTSLTRDWQRFFDATLFQSYTTPLSVPAEIASIEKEYTRMAQHWKLLFQSYTAAPLLPVVHDSILLLLQRYDDPQVSLDYLAEKLRFSKSYVSRIFKKQLHLTVVDFLQQLRMEYARHLLEMTEDPVKLISQQTGYPDPQYFSKLFHRSTGVYPTEYRALHQRGKENARTC